MRRHNNGGTRDSALNVPPAEFRSYYGRPIVKAPVWRWNIPAYLFTGGLAAGSSLLAACADLTGRPELRRAGRLTALGAIGVSTYLLVHDLGRPERLHHMLRVAKPTSPMSVGVWVLAAMGSAAGVAAVAELAPRPPRRGASGLPRPGASGLPRRGPSKVSRRDASALSRAVLPAAGRAAGLPDLGASGVSRRAASALSRAVLPAAGRAAGLVAGGLAPALATYTAVLLADTAIPSWHEARAELPFAFAGSALASAGGMGLIAVEPEKAGPARWLAAAGAAAELGATRQITNGLGLVGEPYRTGRPGRLLRAARALTTVGAAGALLGRRSRLLSALSGVALLAGSLATRFGIFEAGVASARDPKYTVAPQLERLKRS